MAVSKPLDIFTHIHQPAFWQNHTIAADSSIIELRYTRRTQFSMQEGAARSADLLARHIERRAKLIGGTYTLIASANMVEINRYIVPDAPLSYATLFESRSERVACQIARVLKKMESRDEGFAHRLASQLQSATDRLMEGPGDTACHRPLIEFFCESLLRLKGKYENAEKWSKSAVALAHFALDRVASGGRVVSTELDAWRALHKQIRRSRHVANASLAAFEDLNIRAARSLALIRETSNGSKKQHMLLPLAVPNFIVGGTLQFFDTGDIDLFQKDCQSCLAFMERVRLNALGPRVAEWSQASSLFQKTFCLSQPSTQGFT